MNRKLSAVIGCVVLVTGCAVAGAAVAESGDTGIRGETIRLERQSEADYPARTTLTFDQAVEHALERVRGTLLKVELENEDGFLVYSVEVVGADRSITEVMVDAGSGKILAMEPDETDDDEHIGDRKD